MEVQEISPAPAAVLKKIEKSGWILLGALSIAGLVFASPAHAASVAIGGVLGLGNLRGVDLYFARVFGQEGPRLRWWHHFAYGVRFLVLLAAVGGVIAWGSLPVVGVVVGLSVPLLGMVAYAALALIKGGAAARA